MQPEVTQEPTAGPWATPTPHTQLDPDATPYLQMEEQIYMVPEGIVSGYNYINQWGYIDTFLYIVLLLGVIAGVWSVVQKTKSL